MTQLLPIHGSVAIDPAGEFRILLGEGDSMILILSCPLRQTATCLPTDYPYLPTSRRIFIFGRGHCADAFEETVAAGERVATDDASPKALFCCQKPTVPFHHQE